MEEQRDKFKKIGEPFQQFFYKMDQLFAERPRNGLLQSIDDFFATSNPLGTFSVILEESDREYIITAQLPGIKKEQVDIEFSHQNVIITVQSDQKMEQKNVQQSSYFKNSFQKKMTRSIPLNKPINMNRASAKLEDGILTLNIPKRKSKRVQID